MNIDNFDVLLESSVSQAFEGALVYLQSAHSGHFRQYCNVYKLLLKTICKIRNAHSVKNLYIYNANFDG